MLHVGLTSSNKMFAIIFVKISKIVNFRIRIQVDSKILLTQSAIR